LLYGPQAGSLNDAAVARRVGFDPLHEIRLAEPRCNFITVPSMMPSLSFDPCGEVARH